MSFRKVAMLALSTSVLAGFLSVGAQAKRPFTITERQTRLESDIAKDEKTNELTKKEADGLRSDLQDIATHITKMKDKNGGKLSYKDEGKIEKDLNSVSLKLKKYELNKRVESK
jgi:septal ring factor EnvC (AmiA/AmiB activator)